jgi:hypothetical protein
MSPSPPPPNSSPGVHLLTVLPPAGLGTAVTMATLATWFSNTVGLVTRLCSNEGGGAAVVYPALAQPRVPLAAATQILRPRMCDHPTPFPQVVPTLFSPETEHDAFKLSDAEERALLRDAGVCSAFRHGVLRP